MPGGNKLYNEINFSELLEKVSNIGIERIRFTTYTKIGTLNI